MKTKPIPVAVSLAAGFITCIISFLNQVTMAQFVRNFCLAIVIFYILGALVRFFLNKFIPLEEAETMKAEEAEGQTAAEETGQEEGTEAEQTDGTEKVEETENLDEEDQA